MTVEDQRVCPHGGPIDDVCVECSVDVAYNQAVADAAKKERALRRIVSLEWAMAVRPQYPTRDIQGTWWRSASPGPRFVYLRLRLPRWLGDLLMAIWAWRVEQP
jgi:hypothetical protein